MCRGTWKLRLPQLVSILAASGGLVLAAPAAAAQEYATPAGQALALVNQQRARAGCGSLRIVARLQGPAARQSRDQAARGRMGHDGADGSTTEDRLGNQGYARWAENVAQFQSAWAAVRFWSTSRPHRASMLNCAFTDTGLAVARSRAGRLYWTETFGADTRR